MDRRVVHDGAGAVILTVNADGHPSAVKMDFVVIANGRARLDFRIFLARYVGVFRDGAARGVSPVGARGCPAELAISIVSCGHSRCSISTVQTPTPWLGPPLRQGARRQVLSLASLGGLAGKGDAYPST